MIAFLSSMQSHMDSMFSDWLHFMQPLAEGALVGLCGMAAGYLIREKNWL